MLPIVGALVSSGLGLLADAVKAKGKEFIEEKLGVDLETSVKTEEGLFKLKQLEVSHEEFLIEAAIRKKEQELEEIRIDNANTDSARDQNTRIQESEHATKLAKNAAYYLDFIIVGSTIILATILAFKAIPAENKEYAMMALGSLITLCGTIINFHRGTSHSSRQKDETLHKLAGVGK